MSGQNGIMSNPVGTQQVSPFAGQSMGMPAAGGFDPIVALGAGGIPITASQVAAAHEKIQTAMQMAPMMALGMTGNAPGPKPPGFTAYHGSPHSFDRFDASKIGTGEGNQVYGHGLYVAGEEAVARGYRDNLTARSAATDAAAAGQLDAFAQQLAARRTQVDAMQGPARMSALQQLKFDEMDLARVQALPPEQRGRRGSMYEVQVNADPAHFLDWDKPLSEQSAGTKLAGHLDKSRLDPAKTTGQDVYRSLLEEARYYGDANPSASAAKALQNRGIPGIRYLDQGSCASGEGTHNHVIFDDATLSILRKYGLAGLMAGGAAAATQGPQQVQQ